MKAYTQPTLEIILFQTDDIVMSGDPNGDGLSTTGGYIPRDRQ